MERECPHHHAAVAYRCPCCVGALPELRCTLVVRQLHSVGGRRSGFKPEDAAFFFIVQCSDCKHYCGILIVGKVGGGGGGVSPVHDSWNARAKRRGNRELETRLPQYYVIANLKKISFVIAFSDNFYSAQIESGSAVLWHSFGWLATYYVLKITAINAKRLPDATKMVDASNTLHTTAQKRLSFDVPRTSSRYCLYLDIE